MVIDQIDVDDVIVLEAKHDTPVAGYGNAPKPLKFPVSGCSRKPGKSISPGIRAMFR